MTRHFTEFLQELSLSDDDRKDANGKAERVARSLFAHYYPDQGFSSACYLKVGSYGRGTAARPCTDVDMLFILPDAVFSRVSDLMGNQQSQLLREVKEVLLKTYPRTDLRADGQVVLAPFDSYSVEVVPAFRLPDGTFLTADTSNDGSWRLCNPVKEFEVLRSVDLTSDRKATHLTMMAKTWKRECNIELKSTSIEVLASIFVDQWQFKTQTIFYYDWMVRDFFGFLFEYVNGWTRIIGTENKIQLGDAWVSKLHTAYERAVKACEYERADRGLHAAREWQKIFGDQFPETMHYLWSEVGATS